MQSPKSNTQTTYRKNENFNSFFQYSKTLKNQDQLKFEKFYMFSQGKKTYKEIELAQHHHFIVKFMKKKNQFLIVDLLDSYVQLVENNIIGHGIEFHNGNESFQFFGSKILEWFETVKKYCFQDDFDAKYRCLHLINKGWHYKIYEVANIFEDSNYCVKFYDKQLLIKQSDLEAVCKEIQVLRTIHHSDILNMIEVFCNDQGYFIVYELCQVGTLSDLIKKFTLPENQIAKIMFTLINTVAYLHENDVIHRNIKPDNIFIKSVFAPHKLILTDFSLADFFRKDGKYLFTRCGTPGFVAPEILQDKIYNHQVDIYSLGVVFYQLLCGTSPFQSKNYNERLYLNYHGNVNFQLTQYATNEAQDLLKQLLEINPQKRITAQKAKWHPFFKGLHKLKLNDQEMGPEKRNSTVRLSLKQGLPPKIVENLQNITQPVFTLPPGSKPYSRRQKFRITFKNNYQSPTSSSPSPILSPNRSSRKFTSQQSIITQIGVINEFNLSPIQ